jgi:vacuolar-type H+-ATPase subunit F/Vma7
MLFLGDDRLADGFRLIGFETFPSPDPDQVSQVFSELLRNREKAFVIVDDRIMRSDIEGVAQVRREGGRIVVVSVPQLNQPMQLASEVSDRIAALFGNGGAT